MTGEWRTGRIGWAFYLGLLALACRCPAQEFPTAKPEDVGVSAAKVRELSTFMQSLVDQGKIAGGVAPAQFI